MMRGFEESLLAAQVELGAAQRRLAELSTPSDDRHAETALKKELQEAQHRESEYTKKHAEQMEAEEQARIAMAKEYEDSWECSECSERTGNIHDTCEFCGARRDSGRVAWARSDTPYESRDGKSCLAPLELDQTLSQEFQDALKSSDERLQNHVESLDPQGIFSGNFVVVKKDEEDPAVLVGVWRERRQDLEEELRQLQKRQQVQQEERASLKDSIKLMNLQISSISKKTREFDAQAGRGASARVDSLTVELRACEDALSKAQQEVSVCQADVTLYKQLYEEAANRTNAELESMSRRRGLGTPQPASTPKAQKPAKGIPPVHATPVGTPPKTLNDVRKRRDEWA